MLALLITALLVSPQEPAVSPDAETCLACHSDSQLTTTTADGRTVPLHVDPTVFGASVHAGLACTECHPNAAEIPHATRTYRNARELTLAYGEQCRRCHFDKYSKTLDSVHQASVARGDLTAPVCVDCHGAHDIRRMPLPRGQISETCSRCHEGVARAYAGSVHGQAVGTAAEGEIPVCTDCHRSHDIAGPHEQKWNLRTPEMCGDCHADEALMKKYGLSTNVLSTYLADFHGKTASLRRTQGTAATGPVVARCTDCHGVHDIQRADSPNSPVMKANLAQTCRQCHADASDSFPAAWLSHYEPSLTKAPLVYAVKLAYAVLIPFMIGGLGLQVLLHLWRLMVNR